jgi:hypothetical protein
MKFRIEAEFFFFVVLEIYERLKYTIKDRLKH